MSAIAEGTQLTTPRLLLRPFRPDDRDAFARFVADPAYRRYLGPEHPALDEFMANNLAIDWQREHSWVICMTGQVVGSIFLGVDALDLTAEIACLLAPSAWGQGIAGEAGRALADYAFTKLNVRKVHARADASNAASRRAMDKAGMRPEDAVPNDSDAASERVDEVAYTLTRERWEAERTGEPPDATANL